MIDEVKRIEIQILVKFRYRSLKKSAKTDGHSKISSSKFEVFPIENWKPSYFFFNNILDGSQIEWDKHDHQILFKSVRGGKSYLEHPIWAQNSEIFLLFFHVGRF